MTEVAFEKLRTDIAAARHAGEKAARKTAEGGSCNIDTPVVELAHVRLTAEQCRELGIHKLSYGIYEDWYAVEFNPDKQGSARTVGAEVIGKSLERLGYDSSVMYILD